MRAEARTPPWGVWGVAIVFAAVFTGCSSYRLQGVVVAGEQSGIEVVDKDDPRLENFGIPGAAVEVVLDPERLRPRTVGKGGSDGDGRFALPIDADGAGFLMLDVEMRASRADFVSASERFALPGKNKRLVITLRPGEDAQRLESDDVLEDTLRDAEPFLRD